MVHCIRGGGGNQGRRKRQQRFLNRGDSWPRGCWWVTVLVFNAKTAKGSKGRKGNLREEILHSYFEFGICVGFWWVHCLFCCVAEVLHV